MGYDLHITRAEEWSQNNGQEITLDEWLAVVRADPELTPDPENGEGFARWSGPSKYPEPWIAWFRGNISSKNPDRAILGKLLQLASLFHAKVQGDDGEEYSSVNDIPADA